MGSTSPTWSRAGAGAATCVVLFLSIAALVGAFALAIVREVPDHATAWAVAGVALLAALGHLALSA